MKRRLFLATAASALAGCGPVSSALNQNETLKRILEAAEPLNHRVIGTRGLAREYRDADVDRHFRVNGFATPSDRHYMDLVAHNYTGYRLVVDGAVGRRRAFSLPELQAMPQQTQITRHDCVEGWSVIGKWSGFLAPFSMQSSRVPARYVVFRCMDDDGSGNLYYESLDMHQAAHPQAVLAIRLNDAPLDPDHGAPVRFRVPTQLGYKSAKWTRIEIVGTLATIYAGGGGYWEDRGYEWYAGI